MKIGTGAISARKVGTANVSKVYLGASVVWEPVVSAPAKYWRLYVVAVNDPSTRPNAGEVEFRATAGGARLENIADRTTRAISSSEFSTYLNDLAFDGNTAAHGWISNTTNAPDWIGWIFPAPVSVNEVKWWALSASAYLTSVRVDSSPDGVTWTPEWSEAGLTYAASRTTTRP